MNRMTQNKNREFKQKYLFHAQSGNVTVIIALCLMVLMAVLAFVINSGILYADKNTYQNAVDAAALAGASRLCDENPGETAQNILVQNLFPDGFDGEALPEGYSVEIVTGYYDETGSEDFSGSSAFGFKSFLEAENLPSDMYANSLLVRLTVDHKTILPQALGKASVPIRVSAVAYLERYGFLALGEESSEGIYTTTGTWTDCNPGYENMGRVHANGNIDFTNAHPCLDDRSFATAVGNVINCPEGIPNSEPVHLSRSVDDEIAALRQKAEKWVVIRLSDFPDFPPPSGGHWSGHGVPTPNGNVYYRRNSYNYILGLRDGDHGGTVYYISGEGAGPDDYIILNGIYGEDSHASQLTIASELNISFIHDTVSNFHLGGKGDDMVYVLSSGDIGGPNQSIGLTKLDGVVFRTKGEFSLKMGTHETETAYHTRILADHSITIRNSYDPRYKSTFDGSFGPPCPPVTVKLGSLDPTG